MPSHCRKRRLTLPRLGRLGVNGHASNLRKSLFDAVLEPRRNIMNDSNRQIAVHVAVAGEQLTVAENGSWLKHQAGASINLHAPPERVSLLQGG